MRLAVSAPATAVDADPAHIGHLVVIGHPSFGSFSHALARAYGEAVRASGQSVIEQDLYGIGFDPLLRARERPEAQNFMLSDDVKQELALLERASVVVLVYPIWFGMPPAAIVGYVDRVLGAGLKATSLRQDEPHNLLAGKRLVLLTTSGASLPWLAAKGQWYGLRAAFDVYLQQVFSFADCDHEHFDSIVSPLLPGYAGECLYRAGERARMTCAAALSDVHARDKAAKLGAAKLGAAPYAPMKA